MVLSVTPDSYFGEEARQMIRRRRRGEIEANNENSPEEEDDNNNNSDNDDGARKKARLNQRPFCTNCEQCQLRKGKCDRGHPRCGWCKANDKICEYKERKKPGLRAGYGRDLERRLFKVEEILETHGRLLEELTKNSTSHDDRIARFNSSQKDDYRANTVDKDTNGQSHTPSSTSNNNPESFGIPIVSPMLPLDDQFNHANSSGLRPLRSYINSDDKGSQISLYEELPPYDLLYSLVDLYFTHVNTWCPILDRRSTLNTLFGSSALEETDRILLHAIVTSTLRFSTDPRLTEQRRNKYYDTSKQRVLLYGLENSSVRCVQAMVILALDLVGSSKSGAGLKLIALIARSVIQLGLSTESFSPTLFPNYPSISTLRATVLPEPDNWIEDESRRRLFWMVYVLDRDATVATAFEFALDEKDIDRKLPCRDDLFARNQAVDTRWFHTSKRSDYSMNSSQNLGTFSYQVEVKGILSEIHQFLKQPMDVSALADVSAWQRRYRELDSKLRSWQLNLPNDFGNMARLSNAMATISVGWMLLQVSYYLALIRLHSSAAYPPHKSPIFGPSYAASQQCYSSVENIVALTHYAVNNSMVTQLGPPFAFSLWVAARVLLVHGSTIETYVSQDIHFLVDTLRKIGRQWPLALRYARILQRVIDEYQESQSTTLPESAKTTPPSVTILADMRRCAYDLDVLISNQPRYSYSQAVASQTPRNAAPSEAEYQYLEAFDFFNYPRLAMPLTNPGNGMVDPSLQRFDADQFNITNFSVDANSDWLAGNFS